MFRATKNNQATSDQAAHTGVINTKTLLATRELRRVLTEYPTLQSISHTICCKMDQPIKDAFTQITEQQSLMETEVEKLQVNLENIVKEHLPKAMLFGIIKQIGLVITAMASLYYFGPLATNSIIGLTTFMASALAISCIVNTGTYCLTLGALKNRQITYGILLHGTEELSKIQKDFEDHLNLPNHVAR
jgi:hypothetical protein